MSHTREQIQQMTDQQIAYIAAHSRWSFERQYAREEIERRRRLRERERENRENAVAARLNRTINDLRRRNDALAASLQNAANEIRTTNERFNRTIREVREEMGRTIEAADERHHRELLQVANDAARNLDATRRQLRQDFENGIRAAENRMQTELRNTANALQGEIDQIHTRVQSVEQQLRQRGTAEDELHRQAMDYLTAAREVLSATDDINTHQWRRGERQHFHSVDDGVVMDLEGGRVTAATARGNARQMFEDALIFQQNVLADERKWQLQYELTDEVVMQDEVYLEQSENIPVKTKDGEETVDVDYWTCGDLSRIRNGLAEIRARMDAEDVTVEQMGALRELAQLYREQTTQAVEFALAARQLSRARQQLMQRAIRALTDPSQAGYMRCEWCEYFNGDPRLGYRAYLRDSDGTRVVVTGQLVPEEDSPYNRFRSEILAYGTGIRNAEQAERYNARLLSRLEEAAKVPFGSPQECSERDHVVPDNGRTDYNAWRHPQGSDHRQAESEIRRPVSQPAQRQIDERRNQAGI